MVKREEQPLVVQFSSHTSATSAPKVRIQHLKSAVEGSMKCFLPSLQTTGPLIL